MRECPLAHGSLLDIKLPLLRLGWLRSSTKEFHYYSPRAIRIQGGLSHVG
jgi:hypothetical protein